MLFNELPNDILFVVMQYLSVRELFVLAQTCRLLHFLVNQSGWAIHVRCNSRPSYSLQKSLTTWDPYPQVRYHTIADRNWDKANLIARPLSRKWAGKLQPELAINTSRLFVGAGNTIYTYAFTSVKPGNSPAIQFEGSFTTSDRLQASRDITTLTAIPDGGLDRTLYVGYADGALERITLPPHREAPQGTLISPSFRERHHYHGNDLVESVSSAGDCLLSLSSSGIAAFRNLSASSPSPQLINLNSRGWSAFVSTRGSASYAVFGTSSVTPLVVHNIQSSELAETPFAILASGSTDELLKQSAVYGISGAPLSSPWGASDQILVSGWYDGLVRVHDLRSSSRARTADIPGGPAPLLPVLSVYDPWTFEPNYCVSCGGGSSSYIAAGTARHSVVALWDVRNPADGWSVHGPGNDSSPVYSVILDSSRVFGVTQSRPFVLDFGPDAKEETYPSLNFNHRDEGLKKRDKSGLGFYVTKYSHGR